MNHISNFPVQKVNFFLIMFNLIYFKLDLPQFKQQLYPLTKAQELEIKKDFSDYKFGAASAEPNLSNGCIFSLEARSDVNDCILSLLVQYIYLPCLFFFLRISSQHPYISYQFHTVFPWSQGAVTSKVVYFFITWPIVGARGRIRLIVLKVLHKPCSHVLPV